MARGSNTGSGTRPLAVRVKRARRRKPSSTEWLARQLNDPYVAEAHRVGYRSRAAFKLIQLDERFRLLAPGSRVVDLGCAPGGWTQVAVERAGPRGAIVASTSTRPNRSPAPPCCRATSPIPRRLRAVRAALGGPADLVLSDMAAPATGHAATDHLRIVALAEAALGFAVTVLKPGGALVAKVFQGGAAGELRAALKQAFTEVRHAKPPASRADRPRPT